MKKKKNSQKKSVIKVIFDGEKNNVRNVYSNKIAQKENNKLV